MDLTDSNPGVIGQNDTPPEIYAVPDGLAHLLPPDSATEHALKYLIFGGVGFMGVITNLLAICVLLKGRLYKHWTYGMILNLAFSDLLLSLCVFCFFLPNAITER